MKHSACDDKGYVKYTSTFWKLIDAIVYLRIRLVCVHFPSAILSTCGDCDGCLFSPWWIIDVKMELFVPICDLNSSSDVLYLSKIL